MATRRILVAGASRGIGQAVAAHFEAEGDEVLALSRSESRHGRWIPADLATKEGIAAAIAAGSQGPLDALLYTGGIWEKGAFTHRYAFTASSDEEIDRVIAVNLSAPIKLVRGLLPALKRAEKPRVLFVGSLSGLEQSASREVANSASKYGLRGAAQALKQELRGSGIGVSVLNPDNVATPEVIEDIRRGDFSEQTPIPLSDLVACVAFVLALSKASVVTEINLAQSDPG